MSINTTSAVPGPSARARCETELNRLMERHPSILFISLSSVDGRSYLHLQNTQNDHQRIAAMTSSLLGLSESYAREVKQSSCRYSIVAMDSGSVVVVRIPTSSLRFALAIGASDSENLATILRAALNGASAVASILQ